MARHPALVNMLRLSGAALLLGACAYMPPLPERPRDVFTVPITNRGHAVPEDQLQQVTVGVSTRADVQAVLGSPSHSGTFTDNVWYYISGVTQLRPLRTQALRSQRVVVVAFDNRGVVSEVRQISDGEMPSVNFVSRETPSPGNERSLLQALFGNVGSVGPGPGANQPGTSIAGPSASGGR